MKKKKKKFNQIFWVFKFNDFKLNIIFRVLLLLQTNWLFGCQNRIDNFAYAGYQFHVLTGISKKCISRTSCIIKVHDKKFYCSKQILKVFFYRRQTTLNLKCPTELRCHNQFKKGKEIEHYFEIYIINGNHSMTFNDSPINQKLVVLLNIITLR